MGFRFDPEDHGIPGAGWVPVAGAVGLALVLAPEAIGLSSFGAIRVRAAGAVLLGAAVLHLLRSVGGRR